MSLNQCSEFMLPSWEEINVEEINENSEQYSPNLPTGTIKVLIYSFNSKHTLIF